jgi:hypothetical protein
MVRHDTHGCGASFLDVCALGARLLKRQGPPQRGLRWWCGALALVVALTSLSCGGYMTRAQYLCEHDRWIEAADLLEAREKEALREDVPERVMYAAYRAWVMSRLGATDEARRWLRYANSTRARYPDQIPPEVHRFIDALEKDIALPSVQPPRSMVGGLRQLVGQGRRACERGPACLQEAGEEISRRPPGRGAGLSHCVEREGAPLQRVLLPTPEPERSGS